MLLLAVWRLLWRTLLLLLVEGVVVEDAAVILCCVCQYVSPGTHLMCFILDWLLEWVRDVDVSVVVFLTILMLFALF